MYLRRSNIFEIFNFYSKNNKRRNVSWVLYISLLQPCDHSNFHGDSSNLIYALSWIMASILFPFPLVKAKLNWAIFLQKGNAGRPWSPYLWRTNKLAQHSISAREENAGRLENKSAKSKPFLFWQCEFDPHRLLRSVHRSVKLLVQRSLRSFRIFWSLRFSRSFWLSGYSSFPVVQAFSFKK